jgi:hypothetical protein
LIKLALMGLKSWAKFFSALQGNKTSKLVLI